jgi:DNA replication protein
MGMERKGSVQTALVHLLQAGSVAFPVILFTEYKRIGLTEQEVMILLHILIYQEKEQKSFPTVSELEARMNCSADQIILLLQKLVRGGFLHIEEEIDELGLRGERYSSLPLLQQLIASFVHHRAEEIPRAEETVYQNVFHRFEQEFGRPLSPMECETLAHWIDDDHHSEALIETALREAVFCGKVNFRYIDRILLEWQRNQVRTPEAAINYSRQFRQKGLLYQSHAKLKENKRAASDFTFYNWVSQE